MSFRRAVLCLDGLFGLFFLSFLLTLSTHSAAQEKTECTLPDCDQAKAFFSKFQQAVDSNRKQDVAGMVRYPLRSYRNGRATVFKSKVELLARYDTVFTPGVRCAIKSATSADVWGNWRGFTIGAGAIWWDRIIPNSAPSVQTSDLAKYPFGVLSVNHSSEADRNCAGDGERSKP